MKKILFVSSEVAPYAKSGGLADVAGSLPKELLKMGYDISIIMPKYREIDVKMEYVIDYPIYMQGRKENSIIRKQIIQIINGLRFRRDTSLKKIHWWQISTWKQAQRH